jgi:hypothetical protein
VLRLASDEDFNGRIVRGLFRRLPEIDLVRVWDEGLAGNSDPDVLAWAAEHDRIVLTHDHKTMIGFAYDRVAQGLPMPGVFAVAKDLAIGQAVEELLIFALCSSDDEWENRVVFIPM